jgi:putative DNA methylase
MSPPVISPKKLIEVALPLDAINVACAREKSIRHGHPSTLHLWWARRPLAAARAVIFAQLVHDPEDLWRYQNPAKEPNQQVKGHWTKARARLFGIIEELVLWENTTNEAVLEKAREEIRRAWRESCELNRHHPQAKELFNPDKMPGLHDPFAGGGSIPLEAQRLGMDAFASDLNPVAVLINKAMIEIPPKFAGKPPVHASDKSQLPSINSQRDWPGATGLADDVRYYGQWMRDEAEKRIGHLYPKVEVTAEMAETRPDLKPYVGRKLTVIAWIWARTVKSPNPAFAKVDVPLASTFMLSTKAGKEAYVEPVIENGGYRFTVKVGKPKDADGAKKGTKASGRGANFLCVMSGTPIAGDYIRAEGMAGKLGSRLMAVVAEGDRGRVYLSPVAEHETATHCEPVADAPVQELPREAGGGGRTNFWCVIYGLGRFADLFTPRQLAALTTFSDLVQEACERVQIDGVAAGLPDDNKPLRDGGTGATAYAEAVGVYLTCGISRLANRLATICMWNRIGEKIEQVFARQGIPMTWDFAEANAFSDSTGGWTGSLEWVPAAMETLPLLGAGTASQADAQSQTTSEGKLISTDPPYYDNIGYADLSDFFYVWLRRSLRSVFPDLFATFAVPKAEELVATPYRHGGKERAETFFLDGMTQAMHRIAEQAHPAFPVTIFYAFKQSETETNEGTASTGWETFLDAVIRSGFTVSGTWPMRTERDQGLKTGTNVLASSIILVCRPRACSAPNTTRREFQRLLNEALPLALDAMTRESEGLHSPVAPVDLSQAIIGPGMAIFSRYDAVLEANGAPMTVKTALKLINRFLAEDDFDPDTQFCLHWFEQYGWEAGKFGEADVLARSKGTSVEGVKQAGVLHATGGNVRLLKWSEYPSDWDPQVDQRLPIWEVLHQLIRVFNTDGETGAASVFAAVQSKAEAARQLAYRLYTICERKNWAEDARAYNEVVTSWSGIESAAAKEPAATQRTLFDE